MNTRESFIGFIGLGAIGSRIAKRLIDAGFKVVVLDRSLEKMEGSVIVQMRELPASGDGGTC